MDDLEKRVQQFKTLQLPGQPIGMHMGTAYLVGDLWREVQRLRKIEDALRNLCNASEEFLAQPPDDMPDSRPFSQPTTAGDCRELNVAYGIACDLVWPQSAPEQEPK
jgi:hypothetical protein